MIVKREREMTVLFRTNVVLTGVDQGTTHRTAWTSGCNHQCRISADLERLIASDPHIQRRVLLGFLLLQVVRSDDDPIGGDIETKFHPADAKLAARVVIELDRQIGAFEELRTLRQLLQHLFDRQAKRLQLLFLHPENVGFASHCRYQSETTTAWLPDRVDTYPLRIATRHRCRKVIIHNRLSPIQNRHTTDEHSAKRPLQ